MATAILSVGTAYWVHQARISAQNAAEQRQEQNSKPVRLYPASCLSYIDDDAHVAAPFIILSIDGTTRGDGSIIGETTRCRAAPPQAIAAGETWDQSSPQESGQP